MSAVASCGVELVQVIAREESLRVGEIEVRIAGTMDRSQPVRHDVSVFNSVSIEFRLRGVTGDQASYLVESFKRRCPLYGTVAVATPQVKVTVSVD